MTCGQNQKCAPWPGSNYGLGFQPEDWSSVNVQIVAKLTLLGHFQCNSSIFNGWSWLWRLVVVRCLVRTNIFCFCIVSCISSTFPRFPSHVHARLIEYGPTDWKIQSCITVTCISMASTSHSFVLDRLRGPHVSVEKEDQEGSYFLTVWFILRTPSEHRSFTLRYACHGVLQKSLYSKHRSFCRLCFWRHRDHDAYTSTLLSEFVPSRCDIGVRLQSIDLNVHAGVTLLNATASQPKWKNVTIDSPILVSCRLIPYRQQGSWSVQWVTVMIIPPSKAPLSLSLSHTVYVMKLKCCEPCPTRQTQKESVNNYRPWFLSWIRSCLLRRTRRRN